MENLTTATTTANTNALNANTLLDALKATKDVTIGTPEKTEQTTIKIDVLTADEKVTASKLIQKMHTSQKSYIGLGHAILEFKSQRLYRETHKDIESWCKDTLDMDGSTARRLVMAAKVCSHLMIDGYNYSSKTKPLPTNEGQARVLTVFLTDENFELADNIMGVDIMLDCYSEIVDLHNKENAVLTTAGAKVKRLTAKWMDTFRKSNYPTLKEIQADTDRKDAAKKAKLDGEEKAKTDEELNNAGVTTGTAGDVETPEKLAEVLATVKAELDESLESQESLLASMRTLQTETREAKQAVKAAGGLKDSKFVRVSLAIGMSIAMKACQDNGNPELLADYAKEMLNINDTFKTTGLKIEDLY